MPGAGLTRATRVKALSEMPAFQPYWGKPAVRNDRGDRGDVGCARKAGAVQWVKVPPGQGLASRPGSECCRNGWQRPA